MENLVSQGMPLALLGIGVVFIFLCLLVLATRTMSVLTERFGPALGLVPEKPLDNPMPPARMAAVIAAVTMHRQRPRGAPGNALTIVNRVHS